MSFLIDTDLLSMLERKRVPAKLGRWIDRNEAEIFLSVVSLAELQYGVDRAPATHQASLAAWLADTRRKLAPATEELSEAVLVRWKNLLADLKAKNRTMSCEDSLIAATALHHGHTIATHNTRHFEPAEVELVDPLV
jgi:predicted nucleic acid-binding protein